MTQKLLKINSMETADSAQVIAIRMQGALDLFERKMSGFAFDPPVSADLSDRELSMLMGFHNEDCVIFRYRDDERIVGLRLVCQCETCLLSQADFCLSNNTSLIGFQARSTSITFDPNTPDAVEFRQRDRSQLEDSIEARKLAERKRDIAEKAALSAKIDRLEKQLQVQQLQTGGGLVRDKRGKIWTRAELMAMCAQQPRED